MADPNLPESDDGVPGHPPAEPVTEPVTAQASEPVSEPISPPPAEPAPTWSFGLPPQLPAPPPASPHASRASRIVAAVLAGLVLVGSGIGIGWAITRASSGSNGPIVAVQPQNPSNAGTDLEPQEIADRVDPAIVDINTVVVDGFGRSTEAAGTGMVVTSSGQVLTNNHVIEGATQIHVAIEGRNGSYTAHVLGAAPEADVALLQIDGATDLSTVTFGDSSNLRIGQDVVALGNALGRGGTPALTEGSITGLDESVTVSDGRGGAEQLTGLIQTDASIQPGESGGALVNTSAEVVGMITAGSRSRFSSSSTIGFAIPASTALHIVNEIRAGHESDSIIIGPPGFLGIGVQELDAATAAQLGLDVNGGVLVVNVTPGTPAVKIGIVANSVITAIDGEGVHSVDELGKAIRSHDPGEQISVTWVDQAGTHTQTATLVTGPAV